VAFALAYVVVGFVWFGPFVVLMAKTDMGLVSGGLWGEVVILGMAATASLVVAFTIPTLWRMTMATHGFAIMVLVLGSASPYAASGLNFVLPDILKGHAWLTTWLLFVVFISAAVVSIIGARSSRI